MLTKRIIPCLDVRSGRVVKGVKFQNLRDAGCPVQAAGEYARQGADELVILDVSATTDGRATAVDTVRSVRAVLDIPLTVGGGVRTTGDAQRLLNAGADKVATNSAAVERPALLTELSRAFGRQCTVIAVDAARTDRGTWEVVTRSGTCRTGIDVIEWLIQATSCGAGEILLTSWDRDGTREGYDLELLSSVVNAVNVPVIASGGADSADHMDAALRAGASAVLAASIFHEKDTTVSELKRALLQRGLEMRPC